MKSTFWHLSSLMGAFALAASGCTATRIARQDWHAATTPNFRVISNLSADESTRIARELELFKGVVVGLANESHPRAIEPLTVYVFRNNADYNLFAPENSAGYFFRSYDDRFAAVDASREKLTKRILYHEYVHAVLDASGAHYPRWYHEGLASFLETARLEADFVELGLPPARWGLIQLMQPERDRQTTGSHLARSYSAQEKVDQSYARDWATVDFLTLGHLSERGDGVDRREALVSLLKEWNSSPDSSSYPKALAMSEAQLMSRVDDFLRSAEFPLAKIRTSADSAPTAVKISPVATEEIAEELAEISRQGKRCDQADALYSMALERKPLSRRALLGRADCLSDLGNRTEAERIFARLADGTGPEADPRLAIRYARHVQRMIPKYPTESQSLGKDARARLEAAIARQGSSFELELLLGYTYLYTTDDVSPGIQAVKKLLELDPSDVESNLLMGQLLLKTSSPEQARPHFERVLQTSDSAATQKTAQELLEKTEQLLRNRPHS